jgi:O-antigen/teichoic acid export membrane protein
MLTKLAALKNHAGFMRYFKNTSWMMAEQLLRILAGLFVGIWVARYLGPEQFGLFSYVLAFAAIFGGIAKLGLDGIMVRELINHPEKRDIYLGTAFWLKIIGAFIVMGLMAAIVPFTSNDASTNLYIFIITAGLVFQSFEVVEFYFQSLVLAKIISICKAIQLALSSMIKIYLVLTEAELIWFVLVTAFDAMSLAISYFIAYHLKKNPVFYKHFDLIIAKQLLKNSWPLMFSMVLIMIYMKIDQIMIKEILGGYEVGLYSAGIRLIEALFFIPTIIVTSLFPAILLARKRSEELYEMRLLRLFGLLIYLSIPVLIALVIVADWLILFLFGESYAAASSVLRIYAFSLPFVFLTVASSRWFLAENLQRMLFYRAFLAVLINIALNFSLIPKYGINGAAIATVLTYMFIAMLLDLFNLKTWILLKYKIKSVLFWRFL